MRNTVVSGVEKKAQASVVTRAVRTSTATTVLDSTIYSYQLTKVNQKVLKLLCASSVRMKATLKMSKHSPIKTSNLTSPRLSKLIRQVYSEFQIFLKMSRNQSN